MAYSRRTFLVGAGAAAAAAATRTRPGRPRKRRDATVTAAAMTVNAYIGRATIPSQADPAPNPSWNGDMSTGNFTQYEALDGLAGDFVVATSPTYQNYANSFKAHVTGNFNSNYPDHDRVLATLNPHTLYADSQSRGWQGDEGWYRDVVYFPAGFTFPTESVFSWIWEMHAFPDSAGPPPNVGITINTSSYTGTPHPYNGDGSGNTTPHFSMRVAGGSGITSSWDGKNSNQAFPAPLGTTNDTVWQWIVGPNVVYDQWIEHVVHAKWDWRTVANGGTPLVEWWVNRVKYATYTGPTLGFYNDTLPSVGGSQPGGGQAYFDCGYYREHNASNPVDMYHAAVMIGPTAASIGVNSATLGS